MYDDFDEELDKGPEGSIITPIFLGCGAMGLGCLFSVAAIAIALMVFVPNIWGLITSLSDDDVLMEQTFTMVSTNEEVLAAIGSPMEPDLIDFDTIGLEEDTFELGDALEFVSHYSVTGPEGRAIVTAVGSQVLMQDSGWTVVSVSVELEDKTVIHVLPSSTDVPPPPAQLAPPSESMDAPEEVLEREDDVPMLEEPMDEDRKE